MKIKKFFERQSISAAVLVTGFAFTPMVCNKHNSVRGLRFSDALIILVFFIFMSWIFEELAKKSKDQ